MSRLDRYGEEVVEDLGAGETKVDDWHDPYCHEGWVGEDLDGRPMPCLDCRPHLRWRRRSS